LHACTIIAKNYLAFARVLAQSFSQAHPDSRLWVLVIDDYSGHFEPEQEPFEVLTPSEIGCAPFTAMALRYSVLELSTAVKPWLLRHLLAETGGPVTYLDPDIRIFGSLQRLDHLAERHGVVLTPHTSKPIPQDGRRPSQVDVMISGIYNLGYVTLADRPETEELLDWWADRLERDCRVDPVWGYFVDQRWFDLAPGFLTEVKILRDPEYNVAYWNLHERRLTRRDAGYKVADRPLAFFHFSGFDPDHPTALSRYQDRVDVLAAPALRTMLAEYARALKDAGHARARDWPYSYAALGDGTRLEETQRALFERFAHESPVEVPSPFTPEGMRAFRDWMLQTAPGAPPGVNRVLHHVYERRSDLRRVFTSSGGIDGAGLLGWAREYAAREEPLIAHLMTGEATPTQPPTGDRPAPPTPSRAAIDSLGADVLPTAARNNSGPLQREPWGVNVVGYFRSELGTGQAARQMVSALDRAGVPLLPIHGQTIPLSRQEHPYETASPDEAPFPVNLISMNADMLPEFVRQVGAEFFAERYSIGLWFWEVAQFPERWRSSFSLVEEVWAPTAHVASALAPLATVPVNTVRIPVAPPAVPPRSRAHLGLPQDEFVFFTSFDYLSVAERKNPLATIAAFRRAFVPAEGAALVVKCINHERDAAYHARVMQAASGHPDIHVIDRYMSPEDNADLAARCDCCVSLHRAEGFGLVMADAMWYARPVIATGYSGNLDFMTSTNSLLVDHELVPIGPGFDPYPADGCWAQPDAEHAAGLMRRVFENREYARRLGARAAADIRATHSAAAVGAMLLARLEQIRAVGQARRTQAAPQASPAVAALPLKIRQGPMPAGRRSAIGRGLVRKAALRAMRPFTAYQQGVNRQIADALQELGGGLHEGRRQSGGELTRVLRELRDVEELRGLRTQLAEQAERIDRLERQLTGGEADAEVDAPVRS